MPLEIAELVQDAEGRFGRNGRRPFPNEARAGQSGHCERQLALAADPQQAIALHAEVLTEAATIESARLNFSLFHHWSHKAIRRWIYSPKGHIVASIETIVSVQVADPDSCRPQRANRKIDRKRKR
ncbi:hypothetical protein [Bradyrhizobium sp. cir1]|uniref:hypothetical protein n=1 Tax=Bradyrhizobium sp. cir1 TaxID=1445730 RepID=UPI001FEEFA15|nr:hypothetical protein [Bradyrhizobium sp. cir1]